jgi:hypothetical protein
MLHHVSLSLHRRYGSYYDGARIHILVGPTWRWSRIGERITCPSMSEALFYAELLTISASRRRRFTRHFSPRRRCVGSQLLRPLPPGPMTPLFHFHVTPHALVQVVKFLNPPVIDPRHPGEVFQQYFCLAMTFRCVDRTVSYVRTM